MLACGGSLPEGANVLATIDHLMRDAISMHSAPARRRECTRDHRSPDEGRNQRRAVEISRSRGPRPIRRNLSNQRPSTAINSKR